MMTWGEHVQMGDSQNDTLLINDLRLNWIGTDDATQTNSGSIQYEYKITNEATSSSTYVSGFERIIFEDAVINLKKTEESLDTDGDGSDDITFVQGADIDETGAALDYSGYSHAVDINGNAGNDEIIGSNFDDFLRGSGNDTIIGGLGTMYSSWTLARTQQRREWKMGSKFYTATLKAIRDRESTVQ